MTTVLLVENNPTITKIISRHLEQEGCEVLTATDGLAALNIIDRSKPDILFTDIIMPKVSGDQLCRIIRRNERLKDLFIAVHSSTAIESKTQILDIDADIYIAKGSKSSLKKHVYHVLDQYKKGVRRSKEVIGSRTLFPREITTELLNARKHFQTIFDNIAEAVVELDETGQIIQANKATEKLLGKDSLSLLSSDFTNFISGSERNDVKKWISGLRKGQSAKYSSSYENPPIINNRKIFLNMVSVEEQDKLFIIVILQDITRQKNTEEKLAEALDKVSKLANHDPLTGLPNLRLASERLLSAISMAKRKKMKAAIMFIDLDGFKNVNDSYGHDIGDKLLRMVADRLVGSLRETDTVARIGGDEFLVVQTEVQHRIAAANVAEKIVSKLAKPFLLKQKEICVGVSIGISIYPEHGEESRVLIKKADDAMYYTKRLGKNNYTFTPD